MSSSPPRDQEAAEAEEDPWADKTTELSFSGAAAARHDQDSAGDSSDEDNEAAPDKMEVDNDADREFIWVFPLPATKLNIHIAQLGTWPGQEAWPWTPAPRPGTRPLPP